MLNMKFLAKFIHEMNTLCLANMGEFSAVIGLYQLRNITEKSYRPGDEVTG